MVSTADFLRTYSPGISFVKTESRLGVGPTTRPPWALPNPGIWANKFVGLSPPRFQIRMQKREDLSLV